MKQPDDKLAGAEAEDNFTILVAYEDPFTHERAHHLCDRLLNRFWGYLEFEISWWSFDFLRDTALVDAAVEAACRAQLIILSAHAAPGLPTSVEKWIDRWAVKRQLRQGVLAALIGLPAEPGGAPIVNYLRQAAEQAQMDFLPPAAPVPEARRTGISETKNARVAAALRRMLDPHRPPSHWGINE